MKEHKTSPALKAPRLLWMPLPLALPALYLIFGVFWIFFSDRIASGIATSEEQLHFFSNIKGWLFIAATALLLYILLQWNARRTLVVQQQVTESEERFRTICENAPVLINGFDENGSCVMWNEQCRKTFGWTLDEIRAHPNPLALFYPDPEVQGEVQRTLTTDPDGHFREWNPQTKEGRRLITTWANFRLPNGQVFSIGHDITEDKNTEEALKRHNVELERFNKAAVGRELRMIELKNKINALCREAGKPEPYSPAATREDPA